MWVGTLYLSVPSLYEDFAGRQPQSQSVYQGPISQTETKPAIPGLKSVNERIWSQGPMSRTDLSLASYHSVLDLSPKNRLKSVSEIDPRAIIYIYKRFSART